VVGIVQPVVASVELGANFAFPFATEEDLPVEGLENLGGSERVPVVEASLHLSVQVAVPQSEVELPQYRSLASPLPHHRPFSSF